MEFIQKSYNNDYYNKLDFDNSSLLIKKKIGNFGIELLNFDINNSQHTKQIKNLLYQYLIIIIKGSKLTYEEQIKLSSFFGPPTLAHPIVQGNKIFPQVLEVDGANGGKNAKWHTDVTFLEKPHSVSILAADKIPISGGDTLWCDLRSSYNDLSNGLKKYINRLEAVHKISPLAYWGYPFVYLDKTSEKVLKAYEEAKKLPTVIHPVVRIHPVTKKPSIFVNPGYTSHILKVSSIESDFLLKFLYEHMTQPQFVLRHKWEPNDIVIWDNISTAHYAVNDYGISERKMRRVTIEGDLPFGFNGLKSRNTENPLEIEG